MREAKEGGRGGEPGQSEFLATEPRGSHPR